MTTRFTSTEALNSQKRFLSPDGSRWVDFEKRAEFGNNNISAGRLTYIYGGRGVVVSELAAGVAVWNAEGNMFAFVQCYRRFFGKPYQRMVIVDTTIKTITVFQDKFTRLLLRRFADGMVYGTDFGERLCLVGFNISSSKIKTQSRYSLDTKF